MPPGRSTTADEGDPWVYFVHGTTTGLWNGGLPIDAEAGGGDFGAGFYTFEDTGWGRQVASRWARRMVITHGGDPILIRVKMRRSSFLGLDREDVADDAIETAYNTLYRVGRTGKELVVGPIGKRGRDGRRVPDRSLPRQYKFEGSGVSKLILDAVLQVQ